VAFAARQIVEPNIGRINLKRVHGRFGISGVELCEIITRCRCGAALPWSGVLAGMASMRQD
jgi:hypothetical protein